ncbi:MAG TPA: serine/threonine-protein kinase [Ktedonosporobacter sp.]|nr:serine/threonine-protein kinase [Ktedonosporobacter sp.]
MSERTGQQLGNYRLLRLLGRGGFAEVYLGEHIYLKTQAAIKVLRTRLAEEEQEGFRNEARLIAHLAHEHIVRVLEFGVEQGTPFLVMEYAPQGTLRDVRPRGSRYTLEQILPSIEQIASALQYAHQQKLVHRDVKPENMLLGAQGEVLLSDFGIALVVQSTNLQRPQSIVGTIVYMAPEQLRGRPEPASDQYALGVTVYEWLCGARPFRGTFNEVAYQQVLAQPLPLRERVPISPAVDEVVLAALAKDPQRRFPSIEHFANALKEAGRAQTGYVMTSASPPQMPTPDSQGFEMTSAQAQAPVSKGRGRLALSPALTVLSGLLILLAIAGNLLVYYAGRSQAASLTFPPAAKAPTPVSGDLYQMATSGTPAFTDPLTGPSVMGWSNAAPAHEVQNCTYAKDGVHLTSANVICEANPITLTNFAFQVQMTCLQCEADDGGGLIFRDDLARGTNYILVITSNGFVVLATDTPSGASYPLGPRSSSVVYTGQNQMNLLTVIARSTLIDLYINKQHIGQVNDNTSHAGRLGVVSLGGKHATDIVFSNAQVWNLA